MIGRAIIFTGALVGGAGFSQFPEYSQQYEQRLSGAVDEMRVVVANFDATLADLGQTRQQAFAPGQDLSMREARMLQNAQTNIDRLAFLETSLARVTNTSVLTRVIQTPMVMDQKIARRAFQDFKPAVPLTVEGLACAGLGFIVAWFCFAFVIGLLRWPFSRRQVAQ